MSQIDYTTTEPVAIPVCPVKPDRCQSASDEAIISRDANAHADHEIVTREGFVSFAKEHHRRLIYYFLRKHLTLEDAQDLAQETFLVLWTKRERSQPPHLKFLFGIARRLYYAFLKTRSITPAVFDELANAISPLDDSDHPNEGDLDEMPVQGSLSMDMLLQSDHLTQKQRKVMQLIYVDGLSMQETGDKLGIAKGSAQLYARRAVAELRRIWFSSNQKNK